MASYASTASSWRRVRPISSRPSRSRYWVKSSSGNSTSDLATGLRPLALDVDRHNPVGSFRPLGEAHPPFRWIATVTNPVSSRCFGRCRRTGVKRPPRSRSPWSAQTACSRDEPTPKFGPAIRIVAPANSGRLRTKSGSFSRQDENKPTPKPVRSTRLSQSAGMIWSVSTSLRSSGSAVPVITRDWFHFPLNRGWIRRRLGLEVTGLQASQTPNHRCRGGNRRRDEVSAAAVTLPALEVPVAGRGASLFRLELIRVHAEAHRATGRTPLEACRLEDRSSPSASAWDFTRIDPGTTIARMPSRTRRPSSTDAASRRSSIRLLVQEPMKTVSTGISRIGVPGLRSM